MKWRFLGQFCKSLSEKGVPREGDQSLNTSSYWVFRILYELCVDPTCSFSVLTILASLRIWRDGDSSLELSSL